MPKSWNRLIFINQTLGLGGAETFGEDLLTGLQAEDLEVVCYLTNPTFAARLKKHRLTCHHLPLILDIIGDWKGLVKAALIWPAVVWQYWQVIRSLKPTDLIVMSGFIEKVIVTPLAKLKKIPVVWIEYGPITPLEQKFFGFPAWLLKQTVGGANLIITAAENTAQNLRQRLPTNRPTITVIPCGRPKPKKYRVKLKTHQLCCVSRLQPGKGQDLLIKAMPLILEHVPTAALKIVGEGDFATELRQLISKLGLEDHVQLTGRVPDALQVMAESEICVFPSVWELEGFGLVTIEAMSLGKPVVAFDTGPTPELIEDGKTGVLIEPGNVEAVAEVIVELLEKPRLAEKIGSAAEKSFNNRFSITQTVNLYHQVLGQL